jgi:hypothetical protein
MVRFISNTLSRLTRDAILIFFSLIRQAPANRRFTNLSIARQMSVDLRKRIAG